MSSESRKRKHSPEKDIETSQEPQKREKVTFPHGNYINYYGYRYDVANTKMKDYYDPRIAALNKKSNKYFKNKDVLDIGCNSGMITLIIAKKYLPRKIVGCDIDKKLIDLARKNIKHFQGDTNISGHSTQGELTIEKPPETFTSKRGDITAPILHSVNPDGSFPNNVLFFSGDYCPKNNDNVNDQTPEYDTICAFSVSKWIHLNNLDEGLIRFFQRIYKALRTGGYFILEPQGWGSYNKKKRSFPECLKQNLKKLKLRPDMFEDILVGSIGFKKCIKIYPKVLKKHENTNFEREILIFEK